MDTTNNLFTSWLPGASGAGGMLPQPAPTVSLLATLSPENMAALRAMVREEVRAALSIPPNYEEVRAALSRYHELLETVPPELACDADWRTKCEALQFVAGLILEAKPVPREITLGEAAKMAQKGRPE